MFSPLLLRLPPLRACVCRAPEAAAARVARARRALTIALHSAGFAALRARNEAFVDKTGAIADLLVGEEGMWHTPCAFFARPRKFGKSLTLDICAAMLSAGELPAGAAPWPGYVPVDVNAAFGGLAVHARVLAGDLSLRGLLQRAHFVVHLGLGDAQTGAELKSAIFDSIMSIATSAFGRELAADVRQASTPGSALGVLISAVPRGVPVALLVDEYDAAIVQDVVKGRWAAADDGVAALRSLMMVTKAPLVGARIERCIVTGVARFARTSLFSGANNFADMTDSPLLSRVLGFSEAEIRATFPAELSRLAARLRTDVDGAVAELARWYNGYCFDGATSTFNPFAVLSALKAGAISERELAAASGTNWLGLAPRAVVAGLVEELGAGVSADSTHVDIVDLEARSVQVVPLLLQTGLLSFAEGQPQQCRPPNEYARRSLKSMLKKALAASPVTLDGFSDALGKRDVAAFEAATSLIFEMLPRTLFKRTVQGERVSLRESAYHAALGAALLTCAPPGVDVELVATHRGLADIVVKFSGDANRPPAEWVLEVGIGGAKDAAAKALQLQAYAKAVDPRVDLRCCAILIANVPPASSAKGRTPIGDLAHFAWIQRMADGTFVAEAAVSPQGGGAR